MEYCSKSHLFQLGFQSRVISKPFCDWSYGWKTRGRLFLKRYLRKRRLPVVVVVVMWSIDEYIHIIELDLMNLIRCG